MVDLAKINQVNGYHQLTIFMMEGTASLWPTLVKNSAFVVWPKRNKSKAKNF